ncbi:hypothetical protein Cni_G03551 [Canna indica]|uniref:Uncharacterized protein n=1 Tax=Canna indica TaxID=4628 RepID=A0AAQ3JS35_9LILI|nr:hypothetical protein Cni_G03551 [Canna indica]
MAFQWKETCRKEWTARKDLGSLEKVEAAYAEFLTVLCIKQVNMTCFCFGPLLSRKKHLTHPKQDLDGFSQEKNVRLFSYIELKSATNNFHPSNKIGRGGFGTVYKGTLRNGVIVALKVENGPDYAWELFQDKRLIEVVDPALKEYPEEQIIRYIKVALFCTQAAAARRPSMAQVAEMLSKPVQINEKEITQPGYMEDSGKSSRPLKATSSTNSRFKDSTCTDTTTAFSSSNVTFTEMSPR